MDGKTTTDAAAIAAMMTDAKAVQLVLEQAFSGPAVLIGCDKQGMATIAVSRADAANAFGILLAATQQVGQQLGLALNWVQAPRKSGLVLPGGQTPPFR